MEMARRRFLALAAAGSIAGCSRSDGRTRIGFIVKQPEEPWFQNEWKFAGRAARDFDFDLIKIGGTDGDKVLTAIDVLGARNAQGFIICAPDPRLGTAIRERAKVNDLKVMSVDDRLIGPDGRPIAAIPHVGISARAIGAMAGGVIAGEAAARGWKMGEWGLLRCAFDSLDTGRERTIGAREALLRAGLPAQRVYDAVQRASDTEGGFEAAAPVLTRQGDLRRWGMVGMNDESVLGAVRAAEGLGLRADSVIAVGIGGAATAQAEFSRAEPTGFHASILLSSRRHGYDTCAAMARWIRQGVAPAPVTYTSGEVMTRANFRALLAEQEA